jgi:hypothetical protein
LKLAQDLTTMASEGSENLSPDVLRLARVAKSILSYVADPDAAPAPADPSQKTAYRASMARSA